MNWFKMLWLTSEEREILKKAKEAKLASSGYSSNSGYSSYPRPQVIEKVVEKIVYRNPDVPYKNIVFSSGSLTVVFWDGTVLDKIDVEREFLEQIKACKTQVEIEELMKDTSVPTPPPLQTHAYETPAERQMVWDNLDIIRGHRDFVVCEGNVTMKGVNLLIPAVVLTSFIEILEKQEQVEERIRAGKENYDLLVIEEEELFEKYRALKMFWLKLALNPLQQSREDLLVFCRKNDVRITNNGNLVLYRRIVSKEGADGKYVAFVSQTYYALKRKNEDTRCYAIGQRAGGSFYFVDLERDEFEPDELIGNLHVMYHELPNYENNTYTAWHDNKVTIKIGGVYRIPDDKINLNNSICAAGGLHAAAVDYNYSGYGDTPVVVLVNPCKAITVPKGETGKLRTTEMFIACVNDKELGKHFDESSLASFDDEYHDFTLNELEEAANAKDFGPLAVQDHMPAISLVDLDAIKEMLKSRIKAIV